MERLTMIDGMGNEELVRCMGCGLEKAGENLENCGFCEEGWQKALKKLYAIEDILGDDYDLDHLRELVEADRDGRCGIPPVKLHQKIFRVFNGEIIEETVCKATWELFVPRPSWKVWVMGSGLPYFWENVFGKTVFFTREAAKAALKGEQDGVH